MTLALTLATALIAPGLPSPDVPPAPPSLAAQMRSAVEGRGTLADGAPPRFSLAQRDSVKNGALTGALVGAAAGAAAWYATCRVMDDSATGAGDCAEPEMLIGAAVGAAIGAGIGVAIDASRPDARALRLTVRF